MEYKKIVFEGYILGVCQVSQGGNITEEEYNIILDKLLNKPIAPEGYVYKLKDIIYEWELVEKPPEPERS